MMCRGQQFEAGDLVWVHKPQRRKGRRPKLGNEWVGPCRVVERLSDVVYRVRLPQRGRKVALHQGQVGTLQGF